MARPAFFDETMRLIQTIQSLGPSGCGPVCGRDLDEISTQYALVFPDFPLTDDQINGILEYQAGRGVFRKGGFTQSGGFYYYVNLSMNSVNTSNQHFVNATRVIDTTQPGPGFLPCGFSDDFQESPYGLAVSTGAFGGMGNTAVGGGVGPEATGCF